MEENSIRIIFDSDPNSPCLVLVEIENKNGKSVAIGTWHSDPTKGYRILTIRESDIAKVNDGQ